MMPTKKCQCIKEDLTQGLILGTIYRYRDCGEEKIIWVNETPNTYEPLFCTKDYFNEHFNQIGGN